MNLGGLYPVNINTLAFIGNYLPRKCGIATFTSDLVETISEIFPKTECWVLAMNDLPEGYNYPSNVRFDLNYKDISAYRLAAEFLNINQIDAVSLQHEFGIFGGKDGCYILELIENLRMPVITTLHTVLMEPNPGQKELLKKIAHISERVVVMANQAKTILKQVYNIPEEKIVLIHHGIPDLPFVDPNFYKDQFDVEGRKVILTFGLLSANKGIEYMISALPEIIKKYPETTYIILGATHPMVKRTAGESYRVSLQRQARELGVEKHIIFHDRFVSLLELCEFLGVADIYVTPYICKEQIVSGTLAYALGAGKAIVSTPYWYAEEMLADGRGRIVPFKDSGALAAQVIDLLDNAVERHAMRKKAYTFSRDMLWKEAAGRYLTLFSEVKNGLEHCPRTISRNRTMQKILPDISPLEFDHLWRLTDDVGIMQHATFVIPNRAHGYCTDDNTRALMVTLMANEFIIDGSDKLFDRACLYLSFLQHAFNETNGRFRNFMSYDRHWIEEEGSYDCHARAIWGLGMTVALSKQEKLSGAALNLFKQALPKMLDFVDPRSIAFGLVGIHAYLKRFNGDSEVKRIRDKMAENLFNLYQQHATDDWPWLEEIVTYANGKIPQALILSGSCLGQKEMVDAGLRSLEWLLKIQTDSKGHFVAIGNHGWLSHDGHRARFDQQPIEAANMIEACLEAYKATEDNKWLVKAQGCFDWFLGRNDLNSPLYDYQTKGCCDGLSADGTNQNQGAESTLAFLLSLLHMYSIEGVKAEAAKPGIAIREA